MRSQAGVDGAATDGGSLAIEDKRVEAAEPSLVATMPANACTSQQATFRDSSGATAQAAPRALLAQLLPSPLACVVADVLLPRLVTDYALKLASGERATSLRGTVTVKEGGRPQSLRLTPSERAVALRVSGGRRDLNLSLVPDGGGVPQFLVEGNFGERQGTLAIPQQAWRDELGPVTSRFEVSPRRELWTRQDVDGNVRPLAVLKRPGALRNFAFRLLHIGGVLLPDEAGPRQMIKDGDPIPARHFEIAAEATNGSGYRVTNERSTAFPRFSIRGGAYLGVGSAQNYDHLTAARSDLVFLMDFDPNVAADHRGILALVGCARDARHFLSMLCETPLTALDRASPLHLLLRRLSRCKTDVAFSKSVLQDLQGRLSPQEMKDVRRVMEQRKELIAAWASKYQSQGQWLTDAGRFNHLRFLQNAGRIIVRSGDLTGAQTLRSVGDALSQWNERHSPAIRINVAYLSNAETWVDSKYERLLHNFSRLPLNPDGVILRTGDGSVIGVKTKSDSWCYQTLPMHEFMSNQVCVGPLVNGRFHQLSAFNAAVGDANKTHLADEAVRRRRARGIQR